AAAVEYVRQRYNPGLRLLGYLVSRFKRARAYQQGYLKQLKSHFGDLAFDTVLPALALFEKSVTDRMPLTRPSPRSAPAASARPPPAQPRRRLEEQSLAELTASVERLGILQPITVRYLEGEDVYQIISGERRYQAAKGLGMATIPCWVKTPKAEEVLVHQIVEN